MHLFHTACPLHSQHEHSAGLQDSFLSTLDRCFHLEPRSKHTTVLLLCQQFGGVCTLLATSFPGNLNQANTAWYTGQLQLLLFFMTKKLIEDCWWRLQQASKQGTSAVSIMDIMTIMCLPTSLSPCSWFALRREHCLLDVCACRHAGVQGQVWRRSSSALLLEYSSLGFAKWNFIVHLISVCYAQQTSGPDTFWSFSSILKREHICSSYLSYEQQISFL